MPKITERINRWLFHRAVQRMEGTPPARRGTRPFTALSMVHHRDVLPYLLAVKTFIAHAQPERVVVVADPSIDDEDRRQLSRHVPGIEILPAASFRRPALPVGGCWERLSAISVLSAESSITQLDADTVTFAPPTEVVDIMLRGGSFVLRSEPGVQIVPLADAAQTGQRLLAQSSHVQVVSESKLGEVESSIATRYVRGCAGFSGFGRNALEPRKLDEASASMRALVGARWDEWGSEQVMSNLLAASAPGAELLPHPRYCNADHLSPSTVLAHYIGYARHVSRDYERRAVHAASALKNLQPA